MSGSRSSESPDRAYPLAVENIYCQHPDSCRDVDVLFIGGGIGLSCVRHLQEHAERHLGESLRIAVVDAGPLDLLTHVANTKFPRRPIIEAGMERFGGMLSLWGVFVPRPPEPSLRTWPYPYDDLIRRFQRAEAEMGADDPLPMSGRILESELLDLLERQFPSCPTRPAPVAIDCCGHRWSPLDQVPELHARGVKLVARLRIDRIEVHDGAVAAVHGRWLNDHVCTLHPRTVVLGVGVERALPLLAQLSRDTGRSLRAECSDHLRMDLHGSLQAPAYAGTDAERLGIAAIIMECQSRSGVPYHIEVKVAPKRLWPDYMPSGDNLRGANDGDAVWGQIQAISAMHDRFPATDLLYVGLNTPIAPVMSSRDASLYGELIEMLQRVASVIGLDQPIFHLRPLLSNHHLYGILRVGRGVTPEFRMNDIENMYVLPPTTYVDHDDNANPTLKSRVLSQYAMEDVVLRRLSQAPDQDTRSAA